ncbi:hypothetical protein HPC49_27540 [Pyxidicoccus fallax]|uniref:Uncharacterized protein n=1 Tax=Pyxidicoccus fallax TaxID=394095 RepID=A0A848LMF6_9BACT|nr:hypothetical protein [Pyxidicoccus fallax]NMO18852.1 hypothetical protein [Pyxidicoccus fallax]NPC81959.1 hypothetical protein [Pyxidicoccus fallax]
MIFLVVPAVLSRAPGRGYRGAMLYVLGGGLLALAAFLGFRFVRRGLPPSPNACAKCGKTRVKLAEEDDDYWLEEGQRREEHLGTGDFDVWWCAPCEDVIVVRNARFQPTVATCEKCRGVMTPEILETVRAASFQHGGELKVQLSCGHCGFSERFMRYTPRFSRPAS